MNEGKSAHRLGVPWPTFTAGQARAAGLAWRGLYKLRDQGEVIEISRGVFRFADAPPLAHPEFVAVAWRAPHGTICLTSALQWWSLTDELPREVHLAVPRGAHRPTITYPPTRVHIFDAGTFDAGRVRVDAGDDEPIWISSADRTVVDMMRLRHRVGPDLALNSLRRYLATPDASPGALLRLARTLRVETAVAAALEVLQS
ncbi:MAG: type IV toxin-antitoxin system AbiEi family antitoxin domain-containing protein [Egibacteraceae bacterium]